MLGRLARWLRVLGYDVDYSNRYEDNQILDLARRDGRIILTRDTGLQSRAGSLDCLLIRSDSYREQVRQVLDTCALHDASPFSRCLDCNHPLEDVDKETVFEQIPPFVYLTHDRFALCRSCGRVYWHGTHAENIEAQIARWLL